MESLSETSEGDEGLSWEAAGGHLTVGLLVLPRGALAQEAPHQQVHTPGLVLTHPGDAATGAGVHLTVLAWVDRNTREESEGLNYMHIDSAGLSAEHDLEVEPIHCGIS